MKEDIMKNHDVEEQEYLLAHIIEDETGLLYRNSRGAMAMPSSSALADMMANLNSIIFNDIDCCCGVSKDRLRRQLYDIYLTLSEQADIAYALSAAGGGVAASPADVRDKAMRFISEIHELQRILFTDVHAIIHNDPAARSPYEVISGYPAVRALLHYRTAHALHAMDIPTLPRMITEMAHSATGIDIHPGAKIGEYFGIDHGTGVVIGETSIIGNHVMIYQGVTLGARNFEYDDSGNPMNVARHPIIEDNVTIYSNASVLGRITVGHDTVIGGNVWLTQSVPPYSRIVQGNLQNNKSSNTN